ncbi:sugar-non-specific nuclease inhibitor NuiA homolog [Chondrocystis sp. NIES-4102]|nr:sugar-non-specific nuclease inhibitor NuiA homolog [Chondrocystis sp. NIES-4102]
MKKNLDKSNDSLSEPELVVALEKATKGLLWYSESEYFFQVICWSNVENFNSSVLLQYIDYPGEVNIVTKDFYSFFALVTQEQEWHSEIEKAETKRYQYLVNLLSNNLKDLQVYLVGSVVIDAYILGNLDSKTIIGLHTKIIET